MKVHAALMIRAPSLKGDFMSDIHEQLVAALRVIIAQGDDPQSVIAHALEDVEREKPVTLAGSDEEVRGPYSPNSWSMYSRQFH